MSFVCGKLVAASFCRAAGGAQELTWLVEIERWAPQSPASTKGILKLAEDAIALCKVCDIPGICDMENNIRILVDDELNEASCCSPEGTTALTDERKVLLSAAACLMSSYLVSCQYWAVSLDQQRCQGQRITYNRCLLHLQRVRITSSVQKQINTAVQLYIPY